MITKNRAIETAAVDIKQAEAAAHEKIAETVKATTATATAGFEQAQVQVKEGMQRAMKTAEQMTSFSQGNFEAMVKSSQILATGFSDMSKLMAATARANLDETMGIFKALTTVKSVKEAVELQTGFARTAMEKAVTESTKLTEHSLKLAEQAMAPISARVNAAVETFS